MVKKLVPCFMMVKKKLGEGGLELAKCNSNNEAVKDMFFKEFGSKHSETVSTKIRGLKWLKACFAFDGIQFTGQIVTTKRVILSFIARLYDPLRVFVTICHALENLVARDLVVETRLGCQCSNCTA
jgi:hypothetical protein